MISEILVEYGVPVFLTILSAVIADRIIRPKSKIIYGFPHAFTYFVKNKNKNQTKSALFYTNSIWIKNSGRTTATKIQIILNYKPDHYEFSQAPQYLETENPDGRFIVTIDFLAPKEETTMEMLSSNKENPLILNVKFSNGVAKPYSMRFLQVFSNWVNYSFFALMLFGIFAIIFFLIQFGKILF